MQGWFVRKLLSFGITGDGDTVKNETCDISRLTSSYLGVYRIPRAIDLNKQINSEHSFDKTETLNGMA